MCRREKGDSIARLTGVHGVLPMTAARRSLCAGSSLHQGFTAMSTQGAAANPPDAIPPALAIYYLGIGHYFSRGLYLAAKLQLADLLKDGPRSAAELAKATGTNAPALNRLLRLLASVGVFA